jgi:hypothetical protein
MTHHTSLQSMCKWMRIVAALFVTCVLAIYLVSWLAPQSLQGTPPVAQGDAEGADRASAPHLHVMRLHLAGVSSTTMASLTTGQRLMLAAASLPYLAFLLLAFYRLDRMLAAFSRGEYFERATVGHLRAFSGFLLIAKLLALGAMHARSAMVMHMTEAKRLVMSINLSNDDLAVLLMCGLFFVIARMMEEGQRLAEENKEFI